MSNSRIRLGGVNDFTLHIGALGFPGTGNTSFIRFTCTTDNASNILTNVTYNNYNGLDLILPGQFVFITGMGFTENRSRIVSVDLGAGEIEIEDIPSTNLTNKVSAVQLPKGQTFIESGSFTAPSNTGLDFRQITGSEDSEYNEGDPKWNIFLQLANTGSTSTSIGTQYAQYEITKITNRTSNTRASFYVSASNSGILQEPTGQIPSSTNIGVALFEVSLSSSLGPVFASADLAGSDVNIGAGFAAYQIAIPDILDQVNTGSGAGSGFPFTGSAVITGSLTISGDVGEQDFFLVRSSSFTSFKISNNNVPVFGNFTTTPTAIAGGFIYSGSNFYAGIE